MVAPDPFLGREIRNGEFRILEKIGTGGMGAVYKAIQPAMNRHVAVKVLHRKLTNRSDIVSRFRREARAMSHLSHPNTARVFLYDELEDGALYIVMEYLEGRNLNQIVRAEGAQRPERVIPILVQAALALEEAHRAGMVHRDLKPENIFVCKEQGGVKDFAKVLDFGLAKVTEREMRPGSIILTQEGMVFGTPEFMAPEQAEGKTLTPASDVYSLALIAYEALTGKLPFEARVSADYLRMHITTPPIRLDERVPGQTFPRGLTEVIDKALAKRPHDRYPSAVAFGEALSAVLGGKVPAELLGFSGSGRASASARAGAVFEPRREDVETVVPIDARGARRRWGVLAVVAAICLTVGVGLALVVLSRLR